MELHAISNLALALGLALKLERGRLRTLRRTVGLVLCAALAWSESPLPPLGRLLDAATHLATFRPTYLAELAARFLSVEVLALVALVMGVCFVLGRIFRLSVLVGLALVFTAVTADREQPVEAAEDAPTRPTDPDLDSWLSAFFAAEATRVVPFPAQVAAPFDILMLNVCSLAWDDLEFTGLRAHPLLDRFDVLLTRYNSAASYSGPTITRLLRGACGQPRHRALYDQAAPHCLLFEQTSLLHYRTELLLNHDGQFDNFRDVLARSGMGVPPLALDALPQSMSAFDGGPIYDDYAVLRHWLDRRAGASDRVAAFYNSVSLHDGNRLLGTRASLDSLQNFHPRVSGLLEDLDTLFDDIEASGRRVAVVLVPEHGAGIRGDKLQVPGLREIPTPAIVQVPVGLRLFGTSRPPHRLREDRETSVLAVAHLVAGLLAQDPFARGYDPAALLEGLPATALVAEHDGTVVIQRAGRTSVRVAGGAWQEMPH
jgi:cellulose synthase operon protein YhjU